MPGYTTRRSTVRLGGRDFLIRALDNRQQFADPDGHAARLGISSAQWSLFGQIWPSGRVLAEAMTERPIENLRILEVGCGLGLASLVLVSRGADIVASDVHPLAEPFLAYNSALNDLPSVPYRQLRWDVPLDTLGRFDLIIGSDVLYERNHADLLVGVLERHSHPAAEAVFTDPGRGNSAPFVRKMGQIGFSVTEERSPFDDDDPPPYRGRLLHFVRAA